MPVIRCGAKTRAGYACQQPALSNGRCKWHGGKSTGPKTEAGKAQSRANGAKGGRPRKIPAAASPTPKAPVVQKNNIVYIAFKNKRAKPVSEQKREAWVTFLASKGH